ncbi:hypothetical protein C8R44DRAFT_823598 [Mycena epipterygia]|nr:hypothetical protein C8R44DRAFT_823598 [Mycena epipterygia]
MSESVEVPPAECDKWPSKLPRPPGHKRRLTVGIVGGGIAGLYAALLAAGTDRVGGRVRTHFFTHEDNQYFEAGAMRIPDSKFHKITFNLIKYVQSFPEVRNAPDRAVELIPYIITAPGNEVFVNGQRKMDVNVNDITPAHIDWPGIKPEDRNKTASELMTAAIKVFIEALQKDFDEGFKLLLEFDNYSFRVYLMNVMGYYPSLIDFMETVLSQTNQFALSVPELVLESMDFNTLKWYTIKNGMSRLPNAMAFILGHESITYGARVTRIQPKGKGVEVGAIGYNGPLTAQFDRVIIAIPPAALKMIADRPLWPVDKEMAIRSMHFEALYKMGLRFNTRFWERVKSNGSNQPSHGGQTTTDLPIRWIVFPSNGLRGDGPGVLMVYAWMTDATTWLPLTPIERRSLALHCIAQLYDGQIDPQNNKPLRVHELLMGTADATWSADTATGDAKFLPGQFKTRFEPARRPESDNRIFFAGEHLSHHHTWISGAVYSALHAVRQMLVVEGLKHIVVDERPKHTVDDERPKHTVDDEMPKHTVDDERLKHIVDERLKQEVQPLEGFDLDTTPDKIPHIIGGRDGMDAVPDIEFKFSPTFSRHVTMPTQDGEENDEESLKEAYPLDLGMDEARPLGPQIVSLHGPQAVGRY